MSLISTWIFFWWINKSRIKSTVVSIPCLNLAPTCFQAVAISKMVVTRANIPVLWTRISAPSPRPASPSLSLPSPKPALQDQSSLQTQPPWLRQVLLYFDQSGFNSYQKLKNQKSKSIFNFGFCSIDFRLSTGKTNYITIIFEFCLLRQIKVFFRRIIFIEFGT